MAIILANTYITKYSFINKKFAEIICQVLEIKPQYLIKLKQIQEFNNKTVKLITYIIYLILIIGTHIKSFIILLIIKLENHFIIFAQIQIKKHGIIIDIIKNSLVFWPKHYTHIRTIFLLNLSSLFIEIIAIKIKKKFISQKIIKKGLKDDIIYFL